MWLQEKIIFKITKVKIVQKYTMLSDVGSKGGSAYLAGGSSSRDFPFFSSSDKLLNSS